MSFETAAIAYSLNKGDAKTALSVCATPSSIIDEFPPYAWQSATACADWASAFEAYNTANAASWFTVLQKRQSTSPASMRTSSCPPPIRTRHTAARDVQEAGSTITAALQKVPKVDG